jgi:hypothetical protein
MCLTQPAFGYKESTKLTLNTIHFAPHVLFHFISINTERFVMFSMITNIYNKKTKGPTLMELFTATGKLKTFFTTRDVRCVHHG